MPAQPYQRLPAPRRNTVEWLARLGLLLLGALALGYLLHAARDTIAATDTHRMRLQTLSLDTALHHQIDALRHALDGLRQALRADNACTAACRRILSQSLKHALCEGRALLVAWQSSNWCTMSPLVLSLSHAHDSGLDLVGGADKCAGADAALGQRAQQAGRQRGRMPCRATALVRVLARPGQPGPVARRSQSAALPARALSVPDC